MQNRVQLLMFMVMWSIQGVCAFQWVWKGGINNPGEGKGDGSGETGGDGEGEGGIRSTRAGTSTMLLLPYELLSVSCLLINAISFNSPEGLIFICMISFVCWNVVFICECRQGKGKRYGEFDVAGFKSWNSRHGRWWRWWWWWWWWW